MPTVAKQVRDSSGLLRWIYVDTEVITPMKKTGKTLIYAPELCEKIDLTATTLYILEQRDPERALALMLAMLEVAKFGDVIWDNRARSYEEFTRNEYYIHQRVKTPFLFEMHLDGFILNPDLWNPAWLNYDYIGAPWPKGVYPHQVGNSGFCIRSVKLSEHNARLPHNRKYPAIDMAICIDNRAALEKAGFKFAPVEEAARFSREAKVSETPDRTFGFHGDWQQSIPPPPFYWRSKTLRQHKT
jgi:hypothetical protein